MRKRRRKTSKTKLFHPPSSKYFVFTARGLTWILLGLLSLALLWWLFNSGYFTIQSISCQADVGECDEQLNAELLKLKGESLLTFQTGPLIEKLSRAEPAIDEILTTTKLPNQLLVQIRFRQPEVLIKTPDSSKALITDANGLIFAIAKPEDSWLPTLVSGSLSDLSVGQQITDPIASSAIKLAIILRENFIPFREILINSNKLNVVLTDKQVALFSPKQNHLGEVSSLQRILSQATIDSEPTIIDLRASKPVITFD